MNDGSWGVAKGGVHDIIVDNEVVKNVPSGFGYVSSSSELDKYENETPGFVAIQYGLVHMWQLKPDKSWAMVM